MEKDVKERDQCVADPDTPTSRVSIASISSLVGRSRLWFPSVVNVPHSLNILFHEIKWCFFCLNANSRFSAWIYSTIDSFLAQKESKKLA
ncbi:hypothetical protein CMK10_00585 [Candidatus Poribacteria bacterium]|uniref:Uncharacterized protein n=1 Tax=marine metagenome TaxID=408172 RepID=A0A382V5Y0_9ZZZZ|nr:hypothetical protein [Candidatus Poribacteria bacterium]